LPTKIRKLLHIAGIGLTILLGAEIAARLDDWLQWDVPILVAPDRERDLVDNALWGAHGRPFGRFRKWKLNALGFRAEPMNEKPDPDRPRILILGASETFGLYEDAGQEYPAQLAKKLAGKVEVVNVAMAGITLKSMIAYWDNRLAKLGAKEVVLYPSPLFYLDDDVLSPPREPRKEMASGPRFSWRVAGRVRDVYQSLPDWIKNLREQWVIERGVQASAGEFNEVPEDRLKLFRDDLAKLVMKIRLRGAEPILLTHASSSARPARPEDAVFVNRMRMFFPRAIPKIIVDFESRANDVIRDLAKEHHVRWIDVDREMTGNREWFADLVHFNNLGATKMADVLADKVGP